VRLRERNVIRAVACFEALKGALVLVAATGVLSFLHGDLYRAAAALIAHAHLNPAAKYPQIFLDAAARLQDSHLLLLAVGAGLYSLVRFVEAWGLFLEKAWAEVLAAGSGAIYVPLELVELVRRATWHGGALLAVNVAIVAIMLHALHRRRAGGSSSSSAG